MKVIVYLLPLLLIVGLVNATPIEINAQQFSLMNDSEITQAMVVSLVYEGVNVGDRAIYFRYSHPRVYAYNLTTNPRIFVDTTDVQFDIALQHVYNCFNLTNNNVPFCQNTLLFTQTPITYNYYGRTFTVQPLSYQIITYGTRVLNNIFSLRNETRQFYERQQYNDEINQFIG